MTEPEPVIDAHHHIWRLGATPWLQGPAVPRIFGAYEPLRRDYLIDEYMADAVPNGVVKSVFVQVNVAPRGEVAEVGWVACVADRHGFPHATTGYADLSAPDIGETLDRETAAGRLRAVRQQLHWHANPQYRFQARPDLMNDPAWRRGLAEVERRGLMFELQVFTSQMADAAALVRDFPGVIFVLMHAGMLEDRSEAGWAAWRAGMKGLAAFPNVMVKLSGLGTFDRACRVERWRPIVVETVEMFGPGRCLFGSNFPIEKLWTDYATLIATMRACIAHLTADERRQVMHDTARRLYGL